MNRRRLFRGMFFTFYLIIVFVTPIQSQQLDENCVKHYSMSYGKPTRQTSSSNLERSSDVVDGNSKTCSWTSRTINPWWEVDLGHNINISLIQVKNSDIHPLIIRILVFQHQNGNSTSCGVKHILERQETRSIVCVPHVFGRFVRIEIPGVKNEFLSLCEVHVFEDTVELNEGVVLQSWFDIKRGSDYRKLSSLYNHERFKLNKPDSRGVLSSFQSPRDIADDYGIVMIAYYNAPDSGMYTFYMSGDDNSRLVIRDLRKTVDAEAFIPRNKTSPQFTAFDEWNGSYTGPVSLEKDKVYKLTAQMKESGGLDHLRVGVRLPSYQYELPMKNRLFTSEKAANARKINKCPLTRQQQLSGIYESLLSGATTAVEAVAELVNITSNTSGFQPENVDLITSTLEYIVNDTAMLKTTGPSVIKTVNNILNVEAGVIGESARNNRSSKRIVLVIGKYLDNVPIEHGGNVSQDEGNLALHAEDYNITKFQGVGVASVKNKEGISSFVVLDNSGTAGQSFTSQVSLTMPKTLFKKLQSKPEEQRLSFVVFRKTTLFQYQGRSSSDSNGQTMRKTNSFVIAASVKGLEIKDLTEPVESTYYPLEKGIHESTACVFWDFKLKNGQGDWSQDGCYYKGTNNGLVTCHCQHLTNFAILMDVYIDERNDDVHDKALSIISYIGCAVSLLGLVLTIITILLFKKLRSKTPFQILLNFCIALSLTLIVFLAAAKRSKTTSMTGCRAVAIALHYLVLVVFMWMAIEAFNMFMAFVIVIPKHYSRFMLKCCIAGWGLPAVIVLITAATATDYYGDDYFCRVKGLPFFIAYLAPVLVILLGNTIAFFLIFRSLLGSGTTVAVNRRVGGLRQARRAVAILSVLGLTWLFGVLAIKEAKLVFQYLFAIFNSIQGLLVFVFYCLLSSETRAKYKSLLCRKRDDSSCQHPRGWSAESRVRENPSHNDAGFDMDTISTRKTTSPVDVTLEVVVTKQ